MQSPAEQQRQGEEYKALRAQALSQPIQMAITQWQYTTSNGSNKRKKDIGELLSSLHTIISTVTEGSIVSQPITVATAEPNEMKKAYMKAVRQIHPDKYTGKYVMIDV